MGIDIIFKIAAIGIITAVINILLKKSDKEEMATLVTLASLVLVLIMVVDMVVQLFDTIRNLFVGRINHNCKTSNHFFTIMMNKFTNCIFC